MDQCRFRDSVSKLLLPLLLAAGPGAAEAGAVGADAPPGADATERLPPPGDPAWQPLRFSRVEQVTRYQAVEVDGILAARAESECGASAVVLSLAGLDLASTPRLRWRWRIERPLPLHEERTRAGDDFAARVYVMFQFDPAQASLWERTRYRIARAVYGEELPGRAISYVWTTQEPAGAHWRSPYTGSSRTISRGRGALPDWRSEEVDPRADYRRLFGSEPPEAVAIGVMTDADDTCESTVAWFANFEWVAPSPSP